MKTIAVPLGIATLAWPGESRADRFWVVENGKVLFLAGAKSAIPLGFDDRHDALKWARRIGGRAGVIKIDRVWLAHAERRRTGVA